MCLDCIKAEFNSILLKICICNLNEPTLYVLRMKYKLLSNKFINKLFFSSCEEDGNDRSIDERFTDNHPLTKLELPTYPDPSTSPAEQKVTAFTNVPKSLAMHFSTPRAAGFTASAEQLHTPCSTSTPSVHCTTLQERMDLEMCVLRRQEAVLRLQEEYYTLKIKLMKKQMEEPLPKNWSSCRERPVAPVDLCLPVKCDHSCQQKIKLYYDLFVLKLKSVTFFLYSDEYGNTINNTFNYAGSCTFEYSL